MVNPDRTFPLLIQQALSSQFDCLRDRLDLKSLVLVGALCLLMRLGSDRSEN